MRALRGMMTALKDLATAEGWPPDAIQQTLESVREHARILYGAQWKPPVDFEQKVRLVLQTKDSRARLNALLGFISGEAVDPQAQRWVTPRPPVMTAISQRDYLRNSLED